MIPSAAIQAVREFVRSCRSRRRRFWLRGPLVWLMIAGSGVGWAVAAPPDSSADTVPAGLVHEHTALLEGQADRAIAGLQAVLVAEPGNGEAHLLLCRVYLSEGQAPQAVKQCQAALSDGLADSSEAQDWTGRALGAEAAHAGMITGLKLALAVHSAFEAAVHLAPTSEAACVDLGEYYTEAPAVVGGGTTRALAFADSIQGALPAVAHRIRAMAAESNRDYGTAEREFEAEVAVGHTPGELVDLAAFYNRRHAQDKAIAAARATITADRRLDPTVVEAANLLIDLHQDAQAEDALRDYLDHGQKSDIAPAFRVDTTLGSLLAQQGDKPAARKQFEQALTLASGYAPAQKGLGAL